MSGQSENLQWLEHHLRYEAMMLHFTLSKLRTLGPCLEYNAYYESFVVHARNLYLFVTNEDHGNRQARGYADRDAKKTEKTIALLQRMQSQVFHGTDRLQEAAWEPSAQDMAELARWIGVQLSAFLASVSQPHNPDPPPELPQVGASSPPSECVAASPVHLALKLRDRG